MTTLHARHAAFLKHLWKSLPDGPLSERELEDAILRATPGNHEGDNALAGAHRAGLMTARALTVRQGEHGQLEYTRTEEWPEWPDAAAFGSEGFNDELRRLHKQDQERLDREHRAMSETLPQKRERDQLIALIDERFDAKIGVLLGALDGGTVKRLRERLRDSDAA